MWLEASDEGIVETEEGKLFFSMLCCVSEWASCWSWFSNLTSNNPCCLCHLWCSTNHIEQAIENHYWSQFWLYGSFIGVSHWKSQRFAISLLELICSIQQPSTPWRFMHWQINIKSTRIWSAVTVTSYAILVHASHMLFVKSIWWTYMNLPMQLIAEQVWCGCGSTQAHTQCSSATWDGNHHANYTLLYLSFHRHRSNCPRKLITMHTKFPIQASSFSDKDRANTMPSRFRHFHRHLPYRKSMEAFTAQAEPSMALN